MRLTPAACLLLAVVALSGCGILSGSSAVRARPVLRPAALQHDAPKPVQIVEVPTPLPLPGQLKPIPEPNSTAHAEVASDPLQRVTDANAAARLEPSKDGYINAVQVYPYSAGALYQVYAAPGQITDISLEAGEQLVGSGAVAAGDTTRWIIADTISGAGATKQVHILLKPTQPDIETNLDIHTDQRTYLVELKASPKTYMASVSWRYPNDELVAIGARNAEAEKLAPVASAVDVANLRFRYRIEGDNPPWRPLSAFDDGSKVYIQMPAAMAQTEAPPLFVLGAGGNGELTNYRVRGAYYIVDKLFPAAELRLGGSRQQVVRIVRQEGQ